MKNLFSLLILVLVFASCGSDKTDNNAAELEKLKKERASLDSKIQKLEKQVVDTSALKSTPVAVMEIQPESFSSFIEVQASVKGEQNVLATPQAPGVVTRILVHAGQRVGKGQTLAMLDAATIGQQINALDVQLNLAKQLYEKQQKLWAQNIGTQVQLLQAKANYESTLSQRGGLVAQRNMYAIKSPINGTVDVLDLKEGDVASPGMSGIRVVNMSDLKATASLGENYLGRVETGDRVNIVFSDANDTLHTRLSFVSKAINSLSRTFDVEVKLPNSNKYYPNMSCKMQIENYSKSNAITVPISLIQKTSQGQLVYVAQGNKAKAVYVQTGRNFNGMVEVTSGLSAGDKLITEGYNDLDNGENISIQ